MLTKTFTTTNKINLKNMNLNCLTGLIIFHLLLHLFSALFCPLFLVGSSAFWLSVGFGEGRHWLGVRGQERDRLSQQQLRALHSTAPHKHACCSSSYWASGTLLAPLGRGMACVIMCHWLLACEPHISPGFPPPCIHFCHLPSGECHLLYSGNLANLSSHLYLRKTTKVHSFPISIPRGQFISGIFHTPARASAP